MAIIILNLIVHIANIHLLAYTLSLQNGQLHCLITLVDLPRLYFEIDFFECSKHSFEISEVSNIEAPKYQFTQHNF